MVGSARPARRTVAAWFGVGLIVVNGSARVMMESSFRKYTDGGLLILAVGVILYVYSSNYAAAIQSCLNGLLCSLGSFLTGNTSYSRGAFTISIVRSFRHNCEHNRCRHNSIRII
jgi:hypothetical protein